MELIPRISRAQNMDVLSSQATVSGYKSVLIAANEIPKMMPMMMTAAGTLTAARTLVIGAGVAGLQAIATAKRLGSEVRAHDVRSNVKEEVESLGAKFVPVPAGDEQDSGVYAEERGEEFYERQRRLLLDIVPESDLVITSAAVPGKKAPVLLTRKMVEGMDRGSVVVDLAAEQGGNCELTESNEEMEMANGVKIIGPTNLPSKLPVHASNMYSNNIYNFLKYLISDGKINLDVEDDIIESTLVVKEGKILNDQLREALNSEDDNDEGDEK
jgi:NAD(P) transhydrogenase subunit alpha